MLLEVKKLRYVSITNTLTKQVGGCIYIYIHSYVYKALNCSFT